MRAPSLARAAEIENDSWETTKRLVEAFETPENEEKASNGIEKAAKVSQIAEKPQAVSIHVDNTLAGALGELCGFFLLRGAKAQREFALSRGMMPDAIVDRINTVAGDMLGDILLEEGDDGYTVIEDYREILIEEGILDDGK